jgi:hypothetical protein
MLGWLRISNGKTRVNGAGPGSRARSRRRRSSLEIANLRFPLFPTEERQQNRGAHRAILDAEREPRSTYLPPPPA